MTIICTTICIVVTIICATFCFIFVEKYHNAHLSEDTLLEKIYMIAINEIRRSQDDIQSYMINEDAETDLHDAAKNCLSALTTIVTLTRNYSE